jgi:hypothetical protein
MRGSNWGSCVFHYKVTHKLLPLFLQQICATSEVLLRATSCNEKLFICNLSACWNTWRNYLSWANKRHFREWISELNWFQINRMFFSARSHWEKNCDVYSFTMVGSKKFPSISRCVW